MRQVIVKAVDSKQRMRDFVRLPHRLYAGCPYYVPDLDSDISDAFDPKKNAGLEFSDIQPFVAYDQAGTAIGRIAAIINHHANEKWDTKNVRFGFIEFIDEAEVPAALLQAVAAWGKSHGMTHIQGPMGICDFDKEGMLVEDFDQTGSAVTLYNPAYYPRHLERLGFKKEVDWIQIQFQIPSTLPAKYERVTRLSKELFGLRTRKLTQREILQEGYGKRVFDLLNRAYAPLFGYTQLSEKQIDTFLKRYIPLVDKRMISIVENEKRELIGVAITMNSLTKALQKAKGLLWPFGWFYLLRALTWQREAKAELLLIAVHPDYQGLGVNALFFTDLLPIFQANGIRWAETAPQLETNVRELSQWAPLHPTFVKRRRCYIKKIED
ncbi:MAG: N-acetyltransferase [Parabacteroides sp.]